MPRVFPTSSVTPLGLFTVQWESSLGGGEGGLTMALQSTTIHQYDWLVKPVFPPSLSPGYTFSRISVSGVSLNGKHEKLELDLEQVFDLVGFQLAQKSVRSDPP